MSAKPMRGRVLKAGAWTLLGNLISQLMRLGSNLILTRLLMPEVFGVMSLLMVMMTGLHMFSDAGISQSVVRSHRGDSAQFRGTAWAVQLVRGALLALVCLLLGGMLALGGMWGLMPKGSTYAHPLLPALVAAYGICPLLQSLTSIKVMLAQRELNTRYTVWVTVLAQAVALCATIALAFYLHSVWAMLLGIVVSITVQVLLSHVLIPGPPATLAWDRASLRELAGFGRWVLASSIIGFLASGGDRLIMSGLISAGSMGQYAIAFLIVGVPQTVFSLLLGNVVFPAISEVSRNRIDGLEAVYRRFQNAGDLFLGLGAGGLAVAGPSLISLMYGQRYLDAGWMMQILALGLVGMRFQVLEQCYQALGVPQLMTYANLMRIAALFVFISAGHQLAGTMGAVCGVAASQFAGWPIAWWFRRERGYSQWRTEAVLVLTLTLGVVLGQLLVWGLGLAGFPH
jgi:O-antigen/teichoic acid export membrane protein